MGERVTSSLRDTHACPAGCGQQVHRDKLACPTDWYRLPSPLRSEINRAQKAQDVRTHRAAVAVALQWYREHPRELDPK